MKKNINKFEQLLGFKTNNIELYKNAITHKSVNKIVNYEKLEFLGDRVLGLCISKKLLEIFCVSAWFNLHPCVSIYIFN